MALAMAASVAFAQDTGVRKPRQAPPAPAPSDAAAANALDDASPAAPPLRGPLDAAARPLAPVLRSAVHSRWGTPSTIASRGGGACRAQCATTRLSCLAAAVQDEVSRCNPGWTTCLSTCGGLGYARAPSSAGP